MLKEEAIKGKQERLTFIDTQNSQNKLRKFVKEKIDKNEYASHDESEVFPDLFSNSLLSQCQRPFSLTMKDGTKIQYGNIYQFALMLNDIRSNKVTIIKFDTKYTVDIQFLWKSLYDAMLLYFSGALNESLHVSHEMPHREQWSAYRFSGDTKLE